MQKLDGAVRLLSEGPDVKALDIASMASFDLLPEPKAISYLMAKGYSEKFAIKLIDSAREVGRNFEDAELIRAIMEYKIKHGYLDDMYDG
jgi:hypothetical protein